MDKIIFSHFHILEGVSISKFKWVYFEVGYILM